MINIILAVEEDIFFKAATKEITKINSIIINAKNKIEFENINSEKAGIPTTINAAIVESINPKNIQKYTFEKNEDTIFLDFIWNLGFFLL